MERQPTASVLEFRHLECSPQGLHRRLHQQAAEVLSSPVDVIGLKNGIEKYEIKQTIDQSNPDVVTKTSL